MTSAEEIKSKLDMVEVIREYAQLKAAGTSFRALCPFHREKTPSFMVSPEKQIWHCFGCGRGGDVFSFIMEMEGLDFIGSLRLLAPRAGVVLQKTDPKLASKRNRLLDIMELASKYYHKILLAGYDAAPARDYLQKRGLTEEAIAAWRVGYSPESWDSLSALLKQHGFNENEIFLAGLSVKKQTGAAFYDRFRGRIMFPINDLAGNVVGFSARVLPEKEKEEKLGKYINSPTTMIYDKSKILFGLDKAKQAIKRGDLAILVEGQMDAITAHQFSFANVAACSGTSLTNEQVVLLKRYSRNLTLCFDMDAAGDLAAERAITEAGRHDMNIKIMKLPDGKDPDEYIRKAASQWTEAVDRAKPIMQYYFDKAFAKFNVKEYSGQQETIKMMLPLIAKSSSKIEQGYWLKKLSQAIDTAESFLWEILVKIPPESQLDAVSDKTAKVQVAPGDAANREEMLSDLLLALIFKYPGYIENVINRISLEEIAGQANKTIYKNLVIYYNKVIDLWTEQGENLAVEINYKDFRNWLAQNVNDGSQTVLSADSADYYDLYNDAVGVNLVQESEISHNHGQTAGNNQPAFLTYLKKIDKLALLADKDFYDYTAEQIKGILIKTIAGIKKSYLDQRLKEVTKLIAQYETAGQASADFPDREARLQSLLEEFNILAEAIKQLGGD